MTLRGRASGPRSGSRIDRGSLLLLSGLREGEEPCRERLPCRLLLVVLLAAASIPGLGQGTDASAGQPPSGAGFLGWAATPPMGWNSWDAFGTTITEAQVREQADFMAAQLLPHGWRILTVDIQWYEPGAQRAFATGPTRPW